jgi:hypothetical protein
MDRASLPTREARSVAKVNSNRHPHGPFNDPLARKVDTQHATGPGRDARSSPLPAMLDDARRPPAKHRPTADPIQGNRCAPWHL